MLSLIRRGQEMLLGALLYDPSQLAGLPDLRGWHFTGPDHGLIFEAIAEAHENDPDASRARFWDQVAFDAEVSKERLTSLALGCPDVHAAAEYGQQVHEGALRRELEASADRIAELARPLTGPEAFLLDYDGVVDTLRRYAAVTGGDIDFEVEVDVFGTDPQSRREEQVLADLIQHPDQVGDVASWLTPDTFTSPNRAEIYQAILAAERYAEPVDGLLVPEDIAFLSERAQAAGGDRAALHDELAPLFDRYLLHLAMLRVDAGTAVEIGRDMVAHRVRAELHAAAAQHAAPAGTGRTPRQGERSAASPLDQERGFARLGAPDRQERIRTHEALIRYSAAMPARDAADRELYREWAQLDADTPEFAAWGRGRYRDLHDRTIRLMAEQRVNQETRSKRDSDVRDARRAHEHANHHLQMTPEQRAQLRPPPF